MRTRWFIAAAFAISLAIPVGASAHPLETNLGLFSGEMPTVGLGLEAQAAPDFFASDPPTTYTKTDNMRFLGFSPRPTGGPLSNANSDVAFQGGTAYQGTFPGFRIINIDDPTKPR